MASAADGPRYAETLLASPSSSEPMTDATTPYSTFEHALDAHREAQSTLGRATDFALAGAYACDKIYALMLGDTPLQAHVHVKALSTFPEMEPHESPLKSQDLKAFQFTVRVQLTAKVPQDEEARFEDAVQAALKKGRDDKPFVYPMDVPVPVPAPVLAPAPAPFCSLSSSPDTHLV